MQPEVMNPVVYVACGLLTLAVGWLFKEVIKQGETIAAQGARMDALDKAALAACNECQHRHDNLGRQLEAINSKLDKLTEMMLNSDHPRMGLREH
jgi:hypothetical protein